MLQSLSLALVAMLVCHGSGVMAAPMIPIATTSITGTIEHVSWHPEQFLEGKPGLSGSAGVDRTMPAHFQIRLTETQVKATQPAHILFRSGSPATLMLSFPRKEPVLREGMRIRVVDYRISGDEGGVHSSFKRIEMR